MAGIEGLSPSKLDGTYYVDNAFRKKLSDFGDSINNSAAPTAMKMETFTPTGQKVSSLPQYDQMRSDTNNRMNASAQTDSDALQRRFASIGALNSGAAIKSAQLQDQDASTAKQSAINDVNAQEAQKVQEQNQHTQDVNTQLEESMKGRNFSRETANTQSAFQDKVFKADQTSKLFQLEQSQGQLEQAKKESDINAAQNAYTQEHSGGLFGGGGFLGLGF